MGEISPRTPALQKLEVPNWKHFWNTRGFSSEMKVLGILENDPPKIVDTLIHTGRYFYFVVDYRDMSLHHVWGVDQVLGYPDSYFKSNTFELLTSIVHPDDIQKVLGLGVYYFQFVDQQPLENRLDFKGGINFRIRKSDGSYIKVFEQATALALDASGKVMRTLKYFTDISHLPYSNEIVLSIFNHRSEGQQQFYTFNLEAKKVSSSDESTSFLSAREKEILSLIAQGKTSKEIANVLSISTFTVNKHRENMLRKTSSKNINEVISFAYCNEYL